LAVSSLRDIGKAAVEKELRIECWNVVSSLRDIGKAAAEKRHEKTRENVVYSLKNIIEIARNKGYKNLVLEAERFLKEINDSQNSSNK